MVRYLVLDEHPCDPGESGGIEVAPPTGDPALAGVELRIFEDESGRMSRSARDIGAEFLIVSQPVRERVRAGTVIALLDAHQNQQAGADRADEPRLDANRGSRATLHASD